MAKHVAVMNVQSASRELHEVHMEIVRLDRISNKGFSASVETKELQEQADYLSSVAYPTR